MNHEKYMRRCLELAKEGIGHVAPNPLVGCVIVCDDEIIGEGYHQLYGEAHAEVNAINSVSDRDRLARSTVYVSLEPCAHHGKTPPCSDLLIEKKVQRVVIGCQDSYHEVAGRGIEKLKAAGIDVISGILEKECRELNKRFFTFHEKKRPYIILKWAQSADGFMDIDREHGEKGIAWITQPETKIVVHQWRHEEAAIMVGWKTIANDNPELTCREFPGTNPLRIVVDPHLRLDYNAFRVGTDGKPTRVITQKLVQGNAQLQFVTLEDFSISNLLETLHGMNIQSVLVEGGFQTISSFLASDIYDEIRILTGITNLGHGVKAPSPQGILSEDRSIGKDHLKIYLHD